MSDIKFSGVVEEDIYDMAGDELLMGAGDRVRGNLSFHDGIPYILGDIEDVCEEYCSPEYWYPVLENSIEAELFGTTIPLDRLRELAAAEREGCEYFGEDIDGGLWKCTHCDAEQIIDGGTPFTHGMGYCAGCGRPIRTIRYNKWYYNSEEDCGEQEVIETIAEAALAGKGE